MENFIWMALLFFVLFFLSEQRKKRMAVVRHILHKKKHNKENDAMKELAKQFIGKECIIYTLAGSDTTVKGTIKEVTDGGIVVERPDGIEAINLEYVARIREWPRNAKGKKKQIFE